MLSEGIIEINGKSYTWTSPTLADLDGFETAIGPIVDVDKVNSVRGRAYLAHLCLRERQPELTLGVVRGWHGGVWGDLWRMIKQAVPLFGEDRDAAKREDENRPPADAPDGAVEPVSPGAQTASATATSRPSSDSPDGHLPAPDESV